MSIKEDSIWYMLDEYADIRDELESALQSFQILHYEISCAMDDICDEIEELEEHLAKCSSRLIRFKGSMRLKYGDADVRNTLPFDSEE